ncbi:MAG TPA: UDP-N-acetylmuramate dehydrogenase [Candidatus Binatia bacterium]|nr:UDP-N-acetylmuramate dehydrogenase [Candidatus Binatia bacterium]
MIDATLNSLRARFGDRAQFDEPLSRHTSFRIGGPADVWIEVESEEEVRSVQITAAEAGLPLFVLGGGTNVLVSDRGVRGVVVKLGRAFATIDWRPNGSGTYVHAGAGVPFKKLVTAAADRGLTGLEFAEGIPGSLGGGLLMNAGAFGGEIAQVVEAIHGVDAQHGAQRLARAALRFGYRHFDLPSRFVVTYLEFRLVKGDPAAVRERMLANKRKRDAHQPLGYPNAGSIFKNPPGHYAGRLIEAVGLKGRRVGGAMVSEQHANFIVNVGNATAADVYTLIREISERVWQAKQVRLDLEVKLIGEWGDAR